MAILAVFHHLNDLEQQLIAIAEIETISYSLLALPGFS